MDSYEKLTLQNCMALSHHGILGQKWGKKNGPPYPLDDSDHSASERKAGWQKSLDKGSSVRYNKSRFNKNLTGGASEKKGLTDKQKRTLKIGAAVAVTALATYGTYRLYKSGKLDSLIDKGKSTATELLGSESIAKQKVQGLGNLSKETVKSAVQIDPSTGFKLGAKETIGEAVGKVNPSGSMTNCRACSIAGVLRMMGFDVEAIGSVKGGTLEEAVTDCFKDAKITEIFSPTKEKVTNNILKRFGDGSSGVMSAKFSNAFGVEADHAISWSIKDGIVSFLMGRMVVRIVLSF